MNTIEHTLYDAGFSVNGETEYIRVEDGISDFSLKDKALSAEEIEKKYQESI